MHFIWVTNSREKERTEGVGENEQEIPDTKEKKKNNKARRKSHCDEALFKDRFPRAFLFTGTERTRKNS